MHVRDIVVRGSEKVIGHYRHLLATARDDDERNLLKPDRTRAAVPKTLTGIRSPTSNINASAGSFEYDPRGRMIACIRFAPDGSINAGFTQPRRQLRI